MDQFCCPLTIYLDCIVVKIRQDNQVINKSVYIALGINSEGYKELLGLWLAETEGAKFWLSVLTELNNRGLKDIFIYRGIINRRVDSEYEF